MSTQSTPLQTHINSNEQILLAELAPLGASGQALSDDIKKFKGKVHAIGISENRTRIGMSPLTAATFVVKEEMEPILHMITRDRNRIAMLSDFLGAKALGIDNILCTTGTHQTLSKFKETKNVFDIDVVQQLQLFRGISNSEVALVGDQKFDETGPLCLGAAASPNADPMELQIMKLEKKIASGASFLITTPVFDLGRFDAWWAEVTKRGLEKKVAIIAGIQPLKSASHAQSLASSRPNPKIPLEILERMGASDDESAQRAEGVAIAVETIEKLKARTGLRGFEIRGDDDPDMAIEVIDKSGLGIS